MPTPTIERTRLVARPVRTPRPNLATLRAAVEERLATLAPAENRTGALDAAMRYVLLAPGKRLRPILTVLASWELGIRDLRALDAGCAIEMVHAASLVLDDLPCMDDAPRRRGRASAHIAFGEDVAILASVALLGRAFATASAAPHLDPSVRSRLVTIVAEAVGPDGLSGGQFADLRGADCAQALDRIVDANHLKTGILFVAAVEAAAAIAGANKIERERLCTFATHLGQAFQLLDDLKDGQEPGADAEDCGKVTLVSVLGSDDARRRLESHVTKALACLKPDGVLASFVHGMFESAWNSARIGADSKNSGIESCDAEHAS